MAAVPWYFQWVEFASWIATSAALFFGGYQLYQGRKRSEQDTLFRLNDQISELNVRIRTIDVDDADAEDQLLDTLRDFLNLFEIYALGVHQRHFSWNARIFVVDLLRSELREFLKNDDAVELIREQQSDRNRLKNLREFIKDNALLPDDNSLEPGELTGDGRVTAGLSISGALRRFRD